MPPNRRQILRAISGITFAAATHAHGGPTAILEGKVFDESTGQLVPCTIAIRKADGELVIEQRSFVEGFRSNGIFRKELPAGITRVRVTRGFDYRAEEREVVLAPGQVLSLEFLLRRPSPLRSAVGVWSDNHVQMTHGKAKIIVDFPYVALTGQAEALDYLSIAQRWNTP